MVTPDTAVATPVEAAARIVAVETVRTPLQANVLFVLLHTADGLVGLGETFYGASSVEDYIHETAALSLAQESGAAPARIAHSLPSYVGYSGSGAEVRANSAIDIALWDLLGKRSGQPLRHLLGGPIVDTIGVYNTCAGGDYIRAESRQTSSNWGLSNDGSRRPYEDLWRFLNEPGALARELWDQGYRGMKVWPFDLAAEEARGAHTADLRPGLRILDEIRNAVGEEMALYVELHSMWQPKGAERLLTALQPYGVAWAEDPLRPDHYVALRILRETCGVPIAAGESVGAGYNAYKPLLDARAIDVAIIDIGWSGGITQAVKTAALAEHHSVPIAPHDCTGPVALAVASHFVTAVPNGFVQEVVRAFYHGWYADVSTGLPVVADGHIRPPDIPGHGVSLRDSMLSSSAAHRRLTRVASQ
jgi:galactonate dehydratase